MKVLSPLVALVLAIVLAGLPASSSASLDPDPVGVWPLQPTPEVVGDFAPPDDPWGSGHRGVDLAGHAGQAVRSALPGTIAFAGPIAGKPVVTVSHGDTRTTYEPVTSDLAVGTPVEAGTRIGTLRVPFSHCFPSACLHWGWLRGEDYLDPLLLVGDRRVRLLPLWRDQPVSHAAAGSGAATSPYASVVPVVALLPYAAWLSVLAGSPP